MQIFVKTLTGETKALDVESNFKVEEVKEMVAFMTEVDTHHQSVFYSDRQLQDEMILSDVPIKPLSTLTMKEKLMGGSTLLGVTFADVTSRDNFETRNFGKGPVWKSIDRGLNFRGICRTPKCPASNQIVYVMKGFYPARNGSIEGYCNLNKEILKMNCHMCKKCLSEDEIHGISIYKCSLRIVGQVVGMEEFEYTVESSGECYKRALSMCDNSKRVYQFLELFVTPLTDHNPPPEEPIPEPIPEEPIPEPEPEEPEPEEPEEPEPEPGTGTPEPGA